MLWMTLAASATPPLKIEAPCGAVQVIGGAKALEIDDGRLARNGRVVLDGPCGKVVIKVPKKTRLQIESLDADLEILNVLADIDFESVSGSLQVWGDVQPTSVDAATVSGDLKVVAGPGGQLDLSSVSGGITVTGGPALAVEVSSVSGALSLLLALTEGGRLEASSHSGPITLKVPALPGRLETSTFSGQVRDATGGSTTPAGPLIELQTFSSDITIEMEK